MCQNSLHDFLFDIFVKYILLIIANTSAKTSQKCMASGSGCIMQIFISYSDDSFYQLDARDVTMQEYSEPEERHICDNSSPKPTGARTGREGTNEKVIKISTI